MSYDRIRDLWDEWKKDKALQSAIEAAFDHIGFDAAYVARVTSPTFLKTLPKKSKQIKDDLWGMIDFEWPSVRLIDTPILQRLRYIKQLGFTYLTYPSAEHTRFGHALGVAHVARSFIEAINKRAEDKARTEGLQFVSFEETGLLETDVIHAALLHDIGHLPFSHVPEKIIDAKPKLFTAGVRTVSSLQSDVYTATDKSLKAGEVLSLVLILSKRFGEVYEKFVRQDADNADESLINIACLIAGVAPRAELAGIPDIISSASVDSDKIDYVNRDSRNCGIPVGVDVARVFLRSGIVKVSKDYHRRHGLSVPDTDNSYYFVVNSSGLDTIDEIVASRAALYQRVYFHAVTRTAERLFTRALEENLASGQCSELSDLFGIWQNCDTTILHRMQSSTVTRVSGFATRLLLRNLPKRAYAFSPNVTGSRMPLDDIFPNSDRRNNIAIQKHVINSTIEQVLRQDNLLKGDGERVEDSIRAEIKEICNCLKRAGKEELVPTNARGPKCLIVVGTAREKGGEHNQYISQGERLLRVSDYTNSPQQKSAFELVKEIGYVLCDDEWRAIAFFASRVVLAELDNNILETDLIEGANPDGQEEALDPAAPKPQPQTIKIRYMQRYLPDYDFVSLRSSISPKGLLNVERALRKGGYFTKRPWACEAASTEPVVEISKVVDRLQRFSGEWMWSVTTRSVDAFLSQFPPQLRRPMAATLIKLKFIDADEAVKSFAAGIPKNVKLQIVPFSATSGNGVWYKLKRRFAEHPDWTFHADLAEALAVDNACPIVFVDDNASSGVQARAQFLNWLNIPQDQWPKECRDEDDLRAPLAKQLLEVFKKRQVHLWVCAGTLIAQNNLLECLRGQGMDNFVGLSYGSPLNQNFAWPKELKDFLSVVGRSLIADTRYGAAYGKLNAMQRKDCRKDAFGYNNAGGLVTTSLNVPSGTITALWLPGLVDGTPWMPLLVRNKKLRHLVVA